MLGLMVCVLRLVLGCVVCKQETAYVMRISDWSSDVCSSDLCELIFALANWCALRIGKSTIVVLTARMRKASFAKLVVATMGETISFMLCPPSGVDCRRG